MLFSKQLQNSIFALLLMLIGLPAVIQAQFSLEGEFRPRTEFRNGYRILQTAHTQPAFFTSQRSRLKLTYQTNFYRLKISAQDVRVWGDVQQLQDNANVNIHEAWAELYLSDETSLKLGRQELVYDDHRLLGSVNWTQQARSHDALLFKYSRDETGFRLHLGGAYNQDSERLLGNSYPLNNYKVLSYLWMHKSLDSFEISAIALADGFQNNANSVNLRYTYGTHLDYAAGNVSWSGSLYLQTGDDANRHNISSYMAATQASYTLQDLTLAAGYDYLSGGDAGDNNPAGNTFHTLYATNHKFYGHMDYFLNIPADTRNGGLQDLQLKATYKLNTNSTISAAYHYFALTGKPAPTGGSGQSPGKYLGSEMDLNFSHTFSEDIAVKMGYSALFPSGTLESIQQRSAESWQHWGWVMLSLTPDFLN